MKRQRPVNNIKQFKINLQLFAEKTEKATQKHKEQAVQKGQIARSPELNSVLVLLTAFLGIKIFTPIIIDEWGALVANLYSIFAKPDFNLEYKTLESIFIVVIISTSKILVPIVGGALLAGMLASYIQVGFKFNMSMIKFDLNHINPISGIKRIFSMTALAELVKSLFKLFIVGYISYSEYIKEFNNFARLSDMSIMASSAFLGKVILNMVFKIIMWLAVLAVADIVFQRWKYERDLMMSKQEVKDEFKQQEGDPQLKGKIKQKQRQMAMSRMMQSVPKADVVITNPTHFAVALQYDSKIMNAPMVVAKGQDRIALRIKEIARENNVVVVENKPLAQALFHNSEIGKTIPADLFQAVAEVLAFVYKLKRKI